MAETEKLSHPKGLYILFVTEMWERFSYYGMRALFVLFMTKALLFDKAIGSDIYGSYTGLVYLTPLIGGYVADRYWGNRKSIVIGGLIMALGQFLMFFSGSMFQEKTIAVPLMIAGLFFLIIGNGFFKPNISTMVGALYPEGDKRRDAAFTIFYMGINLGAFIAPLFCGAIGDTGHPEDFKYGFLAAGCGMLLSTGLFLWLKDFYIVTPEGKPIGSVPDKKLKAIDVVSQAEDIQKDYSSGQIITWSGIAIGLFLFFFKGVDMIWGDGNSFGVVGSFIYSLTIAAPGFIISDKTLTKVERERIWVIYIAAFFVIFFWAAFEQAGASLTYFAEEQTRRQLDLTIPKYVSLTVLVLIIGFLTRLMIQVFKKLTKEQKGVREVILTLLLAFNLGFIYILIKNITGEPWLIETIPASFFQSINAVAIVLFAPVFAFLWQTLGAKNMEPSSPYKQALGLFLLSMGYLVIAFGVKGLEPGVKVSMLWLVSLYMIHTFGELCLSPIGLSMVNKLAPVKFASLLMGVWFLSTSAANKFAGALSGLYPDPSKPLPHLLGFEIKDLHSFFMVFVIMAGASSICLFIVSRKLTKMMNGIR